MTVLYLLAGVIALLLLVYLFVAARALTQPDVSLVVFHRQHFVELPVEMIRDVRYLLVELFQGVARYPPWPTRPSPPNKSISNSC